MKRTIIILLRLILLLVSGCLIFLLISGCDSESWHSFNEGFYRGPSYPSLYRGPLYNYDPPSIGSMSFPDSYQQGLELQNQQMLNQMMFDYGY